MAFSRLLIVRQHFPDRSIRNIPEAVERELASSGFDQRLQPGAAVAIGAGSRGIANLATILRAAVDFWKSRGFRPFIFPAMGSHGAATAEGQADVLAHYGVHEATMGCPVVSQLEVVSLGKSPEGIEAFMDRRAFEAGAVMVVNRVKWHTDFAGDIESGLFKMMAIGLGKFAGAQRYHTYAYKMGLEQVIRSAGRQALASGKLIGGLAILEDANHNTGQISAVPASNMEQREEELLAQVKSWMGRIPVKELDILIVDEIGKNFSGAGMDTKVVNRGVQGQYNPWDTAPFIHRIFVRDLSDGSYGNAVGIGLSDVVHERILPKVDWNPTRINSLTASTPQAIRIPIHYSSDRECLERIWPTLGKFEPGEVTLAWIRNSLELGTLKLSENLRGEIERDSTLEIIGEAEEMQFNGVGDFAEEPAEVLHHQAG